MKKNYSEPRVMVCVFAQNERIAADKDPLTIISLTDDKEFFDESN